MRVFAISDVHIDFEENWVWIQNLSNQDYLQDALLVAGDVTHEIDQLEKFFEVIVKKFKLVAFVPGNHDLWLVKGDKSSKNSIAKFHRILELCDKYGIRTTATLFASDDGGAKKVWLVPLYSWYHEDFDEDESTRGERIRREIWCDFKNCKWPEEVLNVDSETPSTPTGTPEEYFLRLNEQSISTVLASLSKSSSTSSSSPSSAAAAAAAAASAAAAESITITSSSTNTSPSDHDASCTIISFSHFLPRAELFPAKDQLSEYEKFLPKVIGTKRLESQIRQLGSHVHVFGHTHRPWNIIIDRVHYVQMCLMHPSQRKSRPAEALNTLEEMCIYDDSQTTVETYQKIEAQKEARAKAVAANIST